MIQKKSVVIVDGFDLDSPLVCEGIIGDGCGGGRVFYIENESLFVYDPFAHTKRELLQEIHNAISVTKNGCIITIKTVDKKQELDLRILQ